LPPAAEFADGFSRYLPRVISMIFCRAPRGAALLPPAPAAEFQMMPA